MRIGYIYNIGRVNRLDTARQESIPTEFFLGALELERQGVEVLHFELDPNFGVNPFWGLINLLQVTSWLPDRLTGSLLRQVLPLRQQLNSCDCLVASTSGIGFALTTWKRLGFIRPPVVTIHCGLANSPYNRKVRKKLTCLLLKNMHSVVYGEAEVPQMERLCPSIRGRITVNQFGVDVNFWTPKEGDRQGILSVGNDGRRDYQTLIDASTRLQCSVQIVTSHKLPDPLPSCVVHIRGDWHSQAITDVELREKYRKALCVVVPLHQSFQPAGQSVTLQAMACGTPVVLTKTEGLWSEKMMQDKVNVYFVTSGDPLAIADAVRELTRNQALWQTLSQNGRKTVEEVANIDNFSHNLFKICRLLTRNL